MGNWGCGIVNRDFSRVEGGIYMEHNRDVLGEGEDLKPGKIYWLTDATPHESRPVNEDCHRQFFRLVTRSLSAWYPEHCTANSLVELDPTTKTVHGSKFE